MLVVNYWDSVITSIPIFPSGSIGKAEFVNKPRRKVVAGKREDHLQNRQSEPHAHAIVLDPATTRIAFIPDLGEDDIKQFIFDPENNRLIEAGRITEISNVSGACGPRYLEFHPSYPVAYSVNELASTISVFAFKEGEARVMVEDFGKPNWKPVPVLKLIQEIETIPKAFPHALNTCGRITVDPSGNYVLVSNRGHNSIAIFKISWGVDIGRLHQVALFHTRGSTPRHFQFVPSGKALIVANQDTDSISVFSFDTETGQLIFTGNTYHVPSPNFVCCASPILENYHSKI
eukprot:TRINITY_DN3081_c0_g1_i1.p1 TRINITY_DN3081_c0_g1~~TRINITY_DN3081_c0_g1_i1.p1  ORF type:complete len:289 (+),score=35.76 TRINITY_DN3081_c0_g1_i1:468-1334(+)